MSDRLTDRVQRVLTLARQAAQERGAIAIGSEHILLGLLAEGTSIGVKLLEEKGVGVEIIQDELDRIVKSTSCEVIEEKTAFTPDATRVLEISSDEARALNHYWVGSETLLLGMVKESEGIVAQVLTNLGVRVEDVRESILGLIRESEPGSAHP